MKIFTNSKYPKNKPKQFRLTENNVHNLNYLSDINFRSETDIINDLLTAEGEKLKIVDKIDKILGIYLPKINPKTDKKYEEDEFLAEESKLINESKSKDKFCYVKNIFTIFVGYFIENQTANSNWSDSINWGQTNYLYNEDVWLIIKCSTVPKHRYNITVNRRFTKKNLTNNNALIETPISCSTIFDLKNKAELINLLEKFNWDYDNIDVTNC